jgi:hypothetical protein
MQTISHNEIDNAEAADIGKYCLMVVGCNPLAIEDTIDECVATAEYCTGETIDRNDIDDHTDLCYLATGDLVMVLIGE